MRNKYIYLYVTFLGLIGYSQNQTNVALPEVIPPSPTVANLTAITETSVGNYTGLPEINIPLAHIKVMENLDVNLSISYNAHGAKVKDIASEVGLGWSLNGLGTISRNVVEFPDEYFEVENKIGIYHSNISPHGVNDYYTFLNGVNNNNTSVGQEYYKWNKFEKNLYDTKHDIWSFNFFGRSGRFVIIKQPNGTLKVEMIDTKGSNLKIINIYQAPLTSHQTASCYKPLGFKIIDEYGFEYIFNEVETTTINTAYTGTSYYENHQTQSINSLYSFNSAFHLTEVKFNNIQLLQVNYSNGTLEHITNTNITYNTNTNSNFNLVYEKLQPCYDFSFIDSLILKQMEVNSNLSNYSSKKIESITVNGKGSILIEYALGREDQSFHGLTQHLKRLKSVKTLNNLGIEVSRFELEHDYFNAPISKLFLTEVKKVNGNQEILHKRFEYKFPNYFGHIFADKWGFATRYNDKTTDRDLVDSYVINKIIYPTGGHVSFNFESNTYSYAPNLFSELDFSENPDNWTSTQGQTQYINQIFQNVFAFTIPEGSTNNKVELSISSPIYLVGDWVVELFNVSTNQTFGICNHQNSNCARSYNNIPPGNYDVRIISFNVGSVLNQNQHKLQFTIRYLKPESEQRLFLYGGGIRLNSQRLFRSDNDENPIIKRYAYNNFDDELSSSGALNSPTPIFNYLKIVTIPQIGCSIQGGAGGIAFPIVIGYKVSTSSNVLVSSSLDQSYVGYKNVAVFQTDGEGQFVPLNPNDPKPEEYIFEYNTHGLIKYTYTNSSDYPDIYTSNMPSLFIPGISNHYKRGLLVKEAVFDKENNKINEKIISYDYEHELITTGVVIYSTYGDNNSNPVFKLFPNFHAFHVARTNNHCFNSSGTFYLYCGLPEALSMAYANIDLYQFHSNSTRGWAKKTQVRNFSFFSNSTTPVETVEDYQYNSFNKQVSSIIKTLASDDVLQQNFLYANNLSNLLLIQKNMIVTPLITETFRNNQPISKVSTNYIDWGNGFVSPNQISEAKSNLPLEVKIKINLIDTNNGNPLQVQKEDGIPITYIWGYKHSLPVAKLENIAYDQIPTNLIQAIQSVTDGSNYSEAALILALNNLRNSTNSHIQNAMITTYTHIPLVGISTVTDPKGFRQRFFYDEFNRLKYVKDHLNNIISENKYHYLTQN